MHYNNPSFSYGSYCLPKNIKQLRGEGANVIIYGPTLKEKTFNGFEVENDFDKFTERSDIILADRLEDQLRDVSDIVYTRDLFSRD